MNNTDYFDFNNPPACRICDRPLTSNEWDQEPGGPGSYYSAHFACVSPVRDGRYTVVSFLLGTRSKAQDSWGYTHCRRAQEQAEDYANWNSCRSTYRVFDRETGVWVGPPVDGKLPVR